MSHMDVKILSDDNPPELWVARIKHECIDGCHIFTSEQIPGLLLASRDACTLTSQLVPTIKKLIKLNKGVDCFVALGKEFDDFQRKSDENHLVMKDRFAVIGEAAA